MARPLSERKRDGLYLGFFAIHLVVMFLVDLTPLYPEWIKPRFMQEIRTFYIESYRDQLFVNPPAWFTVYTWLELLYHAPLSLWAIGALWNDDARVPLHLLIYGVQTAVTTLTCVAEFASWEMLNAGEKVQLAYLYLPYLALALFMAVDMYSRLEKVLGRDAGGHGTSSNDRMSKKAT